MEPLDDKTLDVYVVIESTNDLNIANYADNSDQNIEWILDSVTPSI